MVNVSFRLTNYYDVVPHLPPHDVSFLPFWHTAQEVWLTVVNIAEEEKNNRRRSRTAGKQRSEHTREDNRRRSRRGRKRSWREGEGEGENGSRRVEKRSEQKEEKQKKKKRIEKAVVRSCWVFSFQLNGTFYKVCDFSGEDPTCSDSLHFALSVYDHLHIMGIETSCPYSTSSSIASKREIQAMEEELTDAFVHLRKNRSSTWENYFVHYFVLLYSHSNRFVLMFSYLILMV